MTTYKRKSHFEYFKELANPYVGVTVNVDITALLKKIKAENLPFFLTVCYCISRAANQIPEFRQRIVDGRIIEYDDCPTSHTLALEDGTYCYCTHSMSISNMPHRNRRKLKKRNPLKKAKRKLWTKSLFPRSHGFPIQRL